MTSDIASNAPRPQKSNRALIFGGIAALTAFVISIIVMIMAGAPDGILVLTPICTFTAFVVSYLVWTVMFRHTESKSKGGMCGLISALLIYIMFSIFTVFALDAGDLPNIEEIFKAALFVFVYSLLVTGLFAFPIAFIVGFSLAKDPPKQITR